MFSVLLARSVPEPGCLGGYYGRPEASNFYSSPKLFWTFALLMASPISSSACWFLPTSGSATYSTNGMDPSPSPLFSLSLPASSFSSSEEDGFWGSAIRFRNLFILSFRSAYLASKTFICSTCLSYLDSLICLFLSSLGRRGGRSLKKPSLLLKISILLGLSLLEGRTYR